METASEQWFWAVLQHMRPHQAACVLFMTLSGCRVQEAVNLEREDVDISNGRALLRMTKNGEPRQVSLHPLALKAVEFALANPSPETDHPLTTFGYGHRRAVNKMIGRACERAGVKYLSTHKVGHHSCAARMLAQGHSLKVVQDSGGWKSIKMVADKYGHLEASLVRSAVANVGTNLTHDLIDKEAKQRLTP